MNLCREVARSKSGRGEVALAKVDISPEVTPQTPYFYHVYRKCQGNLQDCVRRKTQVFYGVT